MFTGIVDNIGIVASFKESFLEVSVTGFLHDIKKGDSVAINGVCLTVVDIKKDQFSVEVVPETKRRTNLTKLMKGDFINLEKSVQAGGRLGGHFVQGHVDDIGIIKHIVKDGEADIVKIEVHESIGRYIVLKGYVAVDGVSLTVVESTRTLFAFTLIPYTRDHTILGKRKAGDSVNIETDILGKYVKQFVE